MKNSLLLLLTVSLFAQKFTLQAQVQVPSLQAQAGSTQDNSLAAVTKPAAFYLSVAALPPQCTVSSLAWVFNTTAGQNLYGCTAPNVWALEAGGGGGGSTPGGLTTQFQYNNAGVFGGISGLTFNGTTVTSTPPWVFSGNITCGAACNVNFSSAASVSLTANNVIYSASGAFVAGTTTQFPSSATVGGFVLPPSAAPSGAITGTLWINVSGIPSTFNGVNNLLMPFVVGSGHTDPSAPAVGVALWDGAFGLTSKAIQGTDTKILSAGTISGTGATLCTTANGGATTTGCSSGGISGSLVSGGVVVASGTSSVVSADGSETTLTTKIYGGTAQSGDILDVGTTGGGNYFYVQSNGTSQIYSANFQNGISAPGIGTFGGAPLILTTRSIIPPSAFSALPTCNSGAEGTSGSVNDSTTNTWGATITGTGSNHVLAYCDGTNWTVAAK